MKISRGNGLFEFRYRLLQINLPTESTVLIVFVLFVQNWKLIMQKARRMGMTGKNKLQTGTEPATPGYKSQSFYLISYT